MGVGRRLADLWRDREAIDSFSDSMRHAPTDAMLHRHRGHRYITLRNFSKAERDLLNASILIQGQADGWEEALAPNAYNLPLYTRKFNVLYHLALSRYLQSDFQGAASIYASIAKEVPSWA